MQVVQLLQTRDEVQEQFTAGNNFVTDQNGEEWLSFSEAAKLVPPRGVDRATISRWAGKGIRGTILASRTVGGLRYTTRGSLEQFLNDCNRLGRGYVRPSKAATEPVMYDDTVDQNDIRIDGL